MAFRKIEAGLVQSSVDNFIGKKGTIFYDNDDGALRLSDGQTPGGNLLSGGAGGDYVLPTASTTVKGGVKIDGTTIAITNQVIRVGTVPYSSLSGTPTIPTNNNELTNGAAYITSAALSGLATETYVTTRGYLTTVAYADVTGKPTLFSGSYTDLTDKPNIPSLTGYATETFVTTRGYLTSVGTISYNDLTDKPNLAGTYTFNVAADDSTLRTIGTEETVKFIGANGITTSSDAEGAITITASSSLIKGNLSVVLNTDGSMTFPSNRIDGGANAIALWSSNQSSLVWRGEGGAGLPLQSVVQAREGLVNIGTATGILGGATSEYNWQFNTSGQMTFPDTTVQTTAWTGSTTVSSLVNGASTVSLSSTGTLSLPNNGKIASGVNIAQVGSSFAYAQNAFGNTGGDTGSVFLPSDTNSRAIVAGYTLVSNTGVTLTVTSISIVAGPPSFVSVSTTPTASSFTYPVTVYSADYVAGYTAPEWQFGTNGSLTFPNGTTQTTAAESFSFSVAGDDSTQRAISNNELIKFIGAGGITTASDTEGAITITQSAAAAGTLTGNTLASGVTASSLTSVGTLTSLTTSGTVGITYTPGTATGHAITTTGKDTQGGTGYFDFLKATNTTSGATNPNKSFRLNSTGAIEIINSAYSATILSLTDAGAFSVPGPISVSGKQAVNGPAFSAYAEATLQTIPNGVQTKVLFQTEEFDTNSNYASSRFTPTIEGYYQLNAEVRLDGATGTGECMIILYKNGSEYKRGWNSSGTQFASNFWAMTVSSVVYANGTSDYFEIYVQQGSGGTISVTAVNNSAITWFNGCMLRGA
jgi:hypothetical protein